MADSDNTTTLSRVTRRKAIAGEAVTAFSPNISKAGQSSDPAAEVWVKWLAAHAETDRLCRQQQRHEADRNCGGEIEYAAALQAESAAGERAMELIALLSLTPASSLSGVAAKLDAVLGEGEPSDGDAEFPWPLIRSALQDIIRIGRLEGPVSGVRQGIVQGGEDRSGRVS